MKKILFITIFLFTIGILLCVTTPDQAAREQLNSFLQSITNGQLGQFGFDSVSELAQVQIEPVFRMQSLSESRIKQWAVNDKFVSDSLHLYPLSVNGSYKCMLAVDFTKGEWKAVAIGYRDLAGKLDLVRQAWSDKEITIVRVYPLKRYYFSVAGVDRPNCTLISFGEANKSESANSFNRLTPLAEAMQQMQTELSYNRQEGNHEN